MTRPFPPAHVKMPGRPKTQRRREQWEQPKRTKLSKVGIKMTCRLCGNSTHNSRKCPKNPEAGTKKNAHIKRDKTKKRKMASKEKNDGTMKKVTMSQLFQLVIKLSSLLISFF